MVYNGLKHILKKFTFHGKYISAEELTSGNINSICFLSYEQTDGRIKHYVL